MVLVELKMLPGEAAAATKFLESKLHSIKVEGKALEIDDERADEVKLLLKKFLHREGLAGYRVLSEKGIVRIIPDEIEQSNRDKTDYDKIKGIPPFPPPLGGTPLSIIQTVYPNYGPDSTILPPKYKKTRRQ